MEQPRPLLDAAAVRAEGRILDIVAAGLVLDGTLAELAARLGIRAGVLRRAVRELRRVGWVAAHTYPDDQLTIRLERRLASRRQNIPIERRQEPQDAWRL